MSRVRPPHIIQSHMGMKRRKVFIETWTVRHVTIIGFSALGVWLLLESRIEWSPMHRWNRAIGDMSLLLIAAAMAVGPLSRLSRSVAMILPYRRELGIYAVFLALIHTAIILIGWVDLDLLRLLGLEFHPNLRRYVMVQHGFALANAVGIIALLYGIVLAGTSNNASMRWLGNGVWKYIQQGAYVLWSLALAHTAYFLFIHFVDFHRPTPEPNWAQWPFVILVLSVFGLQISASIKTWQYIRNNRGRRAASLA